MGFWSKVGKIGGLVGAVAGVPFTGGMSLATTLPWLTAASVGASALGGALSNTKGARTSTSNGTSMPIEAPEYTSLRDMLIQRATEGLNGSSLPRGFIEGGIQNINTNNNLSRLNLDNTLTARGLSNSPVAASGLFNSEANRVGQINRFENIEAPSLEQQLKQDAYQNALNLFHSRPIGTATSGTAVGPGSVAGGAFTKASDMLAFLYGSGALGSSNTNRNSGVNPVLLPPELGAQRLPWDL